jgi:hypothetical protein
MRRELMKEGDGRALWTLLFAEALGERDYGGVTMGAT